MILEIYGKKFTIPNRGARRRLWRLMSDHVLDGRVHVRSQAGRPLMTGIVRAGEPGDAGEMLVCDYRYIRAEESYDGLGKDHCTTDAPKTRTGYGTRWRQ